MLKRQYKDAHGAMGKRSHTPISPTSTCRSTQPLPYRMIRKRPISPTRRCWPMACRVSRQRVRGEQTTPNRERCTSGSRRKRSGSYSSSWVSAMLSQGGVGILTRCRSVHPALRHSSLFVRIPRQRKLVSRRGAKYLEYLVDQLVGQMLVYKDWRRPSSGDPTPITPSPSAASSSPTSWDR